MSSRRAHSLDGWGQGRILALALLGLALSVPAAAAPVFVTAHDSLDWGTTFENGAESQDVLLVRANGSNVYYVVPPGASATVLPNGAVESRAALDSFAADVAASDTGVAWKVTDVKNYNRSTSSEGPWTPIKVGDILVSCMWYIRTEYDSYLKVTNVATGEQLSTSPLTVITVIVPHHVPWDPRFENVHGYDTFASFGYGSMPIVGGMATLMGDSSYKPGAPQTGIQGTYGEAVVPQRRPNARSPFLPQRENGS